MKKYFFVVILALITIPVLSQENNKYVQYLDMSESPEIAIIVQGCHSTVIIYQDTIDYVALNYPYMPDTSRLPVKLFVFEKERSILFLNGLGREGIMEVHLKNPSWYIVANGYNEVYINTNDRNCLELDMLRVQTDGYASVTLPSQVKAEVVSLVAMDHSSIIYERYEADYYGETTSEFAIVRGSYRNGEYVYPGRDRKTVGELFPDLKRKSH